MQRLLDTIRQDAPPDTVAASPQEAAEPDTSAAAERVIENIQEARDYASEILARFLDPDLWITLAGAMLKVVLLLILAAAIVRLADKTTLRWMNRYEDLPPIHPRRRRAFTISTLLSSSTRYVVWPIVLIMIMAEVGINITALLATAGVAGLAIGFGAQTLVKDVIGGVFLLFDESVHVGDFIRIGTDEGTVEDIGVRLIKVRRFNGELLMVPAGELRIFGNRSIGFARVVVEVGLSYEQDIETVLPIMNDVAVTWAQEHPELLREEAPQVQAITAFMDSSVNARIIVQVIPGEQWAIERELRVRLKRAFDEHGIEIPFPRHTVYMRKEESLPPKRILPPEDDTPPPPFIETED